MGEVLGATAAGVQLFDTAINVFNHVRKSYQQHKKLESTLKEYTSELERLRELSKSVRAEKALEGAEVLEPLGRLQKLENKLCKWLAKVDPRDKNSLRRFGDQLLRGQEDKKKLDDIMRELHRVKFDLSFVIEMHHARMSFDMQQAVMPFLSRTNSIISVREKTVESAPMLPGMQSNAYHDNDSGVGSEDDSSDSSSSLESSSDDSSQDEPQSTFNMAFGPMERITVNNEVARGGSMVNAPLGEKDRWAHVRVVKIKGNKCGEGAEMWNYANTKKDRETAREERKKDWQSQQEERRARLLEAREQMLFEKNNGLPITPLAQLLAN